MSAERVNRRGITFRNAALGIAGVGAAMTAGGFADFYINTEPVRQYATSDASKIVEPVPAQQIEDSSNVLSLRDRCAALTPQSITQAEEIIDRKNKYYQEYTKFRKHAEQITGTDNINRTAVDLAIAMGGVILLTSFGIVASNRPRKSSDA